MTAFDPALLPPLRAVIAAHGLAARKALGQNFLLDGNVTAKIVRAAGDLAGVTVVEIGPGPGGLTRALLASPALQVIAIERDARCIAALAEVGALAGERLVLIEGDALAMNAVALAPAPRALVANLPYNIATPLLIGWLRRAWDWRSLTLMFQKEVAERLVAAPDSDGYGRLSVIAQWRCSARIALTLPGRAFTPPPKVDSAVVHLVPLPEVPNAPAFATMEAVTAAAFGQRRKMLRQSLKVLGNAEALLEEAGLAPTLRAENIPVAGFVALAQAVTRSAPPPDPSPP